MHSSRLARRLGTAALGIVLLTGSAAAQTTRVSVDSSGAESNGGSASASISADGQIVAFDSAASNLVAGKTTGWRDVFVHDRSTGITERVSVDSSGNEADNQSFEPSISADGQIVAFYSEASNLVAGDTNLCQDVFVHDRNTGLTERASIDSAGAEGNMGSQYGLSLSADGQIVAFASEASNLVAGDRNGESDIFVHDRVSGLTERISVDSLGIEGNGRSYFAPISADGQLVAFASLASNLVNGDTNGTWDVFVHDRSIGTTERVSVDSAGAEGNSGSSNPALSADGQIVAFESVASNLVAGDTNGWQDTFVHVRSTGITERVSVDSSGAQADSWSFDPGISADGQIVAFWSDATNLIAGDTNGTHDVFIHDRSLARTERVSIDSSGAQGNNLSYLPSLSWDGQFVAFHSAASNLVDSDTNGGTDVFVHDRCIVDASWANYGTGFPGTNGVPQLTSESDPVLGTTVTLDLENSSGKFTVGLMFVGYAETDVTTSKGGDLLVVPAFTLLLALGPSGTSVDGDLPDDLALCGFEVFVQAIELDSGAAKGMSFTEGLKLVLGH